MDGSSKKTNAPVHLAYCRFHSQVLAAIGRNTTSAWRGRNGAIMEGMSPARTGNWQLP